MRDLFTALLCIALVSAAIGISAPASALQQEDEAADASALLPERSVTSHTLALDDAPMEYTATAGTIALTSEAGEVRANVFFVAYTLDEVDDLSQRPLTFCFNGGPGSSSVWLHMGAFGPRRIEMGDAGALLPPPWDVVDNHETLLDLTDLVFIDPVTTGYSRATSPDEDKNFHGVEEDIRSVAEVIRLYTTEFNRWRSPIFLAGESYGTTRAAGLADELQNEHGLYLNGIMLVSSILNFQTARFDRGNDLPYILFLPTMTATAWYHNRLDQSLQNDLESALQQAEAFATGSYAAALLKGGDLPDQERREMAEQLAHYTGLDREFIEQANLRVSMSRFAKELLRDERKTIGRLDSRFIGHDADAAGERVEFDPSYAAILGPYTSGLLDYIRTELEYESPLKYEILTGRVRPWNYSEYTNRYLNMSERLRRAMTKNRALRVFIASGYYDFATPYFATDYTVSHLGLEPPLRDHIDVRYYHAGHMMYIHEESRKQLKRDLADFFETSLTNQNAERLKE